MKHCSLQSNTEQMHWNFVSQETVQAWESLASYKYSVIDGLTWTDKIQLMCKLFPSNQRLRVACFYNM